MPLLLAAIFFAMVVCGIAAENPKDKLEAQKKAAEQGDAKAQFDMGLMYEAGYDVPKDLAEAVKWFRKAAEQGYLGAQLFLGWMYEKGEGVPKDEIEALAWYYIAAAVGNEDALKACGKAEVRLGREGTLIAQRRSKEISKEIETTKAARSAPKGSH